VQRVYVLRAFRSQAVSAHVVSYTLRVRPYSKPLNAEVDCIPLTPSMYFVYIIETEDGHYYTGQTSNLLRRFQEHLSGGRHSAGYLRMHKPKYLVHIEECGSRGSALKRESEIKRSRRLKRTLIGTRRDLLEVIESEKSYR
jgi:predicted GIY-YIG superfamily endonuclease